tara:strand:- start:696 stop:1097 length:402 start_codon:yes stop_codon:yes gene_type:complete
MMFLALALAFSAPAQAAPVVPVADRPQVTISFAGNGGLRNWTKGDDDSSLYVQDRTLRWYYVGLSGPCLRNVATNSIGYTTDPNGQLDQFSNVFDLTRPEQRCRVTSIVRTAKPPQYGGKGIAAPVPDKDAKQ